MRTISFNKHIKQHLSYSEISLFCYDKEEYYKRYILGEQEEPNEQMKMGTLVHKVMEEPRYPWLKELREKGYLYDKITPIRKCITKLSKFRAPDREVKYAAGDLGYKIFCLFDGLDLKKKELYEYKTTFETKSNPQWSQYRVDYNKQLSFYAYAYWLNTHSFFHNIHLFWIDLAKGNVQHFETARGIMDINYARQWTRDAVNGMKRLGWWEKRLSREERDALKNNQLEI